MLREYRWRGNTWQIADEDLDKYPGAVLIEPAKPQAKQRTPQNKSRRAPKNKCGQYGVMT